MINHQGEPATLGFGYEMTSLLHRSRHRLLDQYVLPCLQRLHRKLEMRRGRSGNDDRIDPRILDKRVGVAACLYLRVTSAQQLKTLLTQIYNAAHCRFADLREVANNIGTPIPVSDDADAKHVIARP